MAQIIELTPKNKIEKKKKMDNLTPREIVAELEYKIPPMVKTGAVVLGLDHRIPNGTPLETH